MMKKASCSQRALRDSRVRTDIKYERRGARTGQKAEGTDVQGADKASKKRKREQRGPAPCAESEGAGGMLDVPMELQGCRVEWMWPPRHVNRGTLSGKQTDKSVHTLTDKTGSNKYLPKSQYTSCTSDVPNAWWLPTGTLSTGANV